MKIRDLVAGPLLSALIAKRAIFPAGYPAGTFRILLLHAVRRDRAESLARLLDYVLENGGVLDPDRVPGRLSGDSASSAQRPEYVLSFDDGFESNFTVARPLLNQRGIKAVFFVCPGLIDLVPEAQRRAVAENLFPGVEPPEPELLMTWDNLAELADDGHAIGGHTMSHARLSDLDSDRRNDEIGQSADRIREKTGSTPVWFAYPFGDMGSIDEASLCDVARHHALCRSGVRGLNVPGTSPWGLHADSLDLSRSFSWQRIVLQGGLDFWYRTARTDLAAMARAAGHRAPL